MSTKAPGKPMLILLICLVGMPVVAQILLYEETFPWPGPSGDFPVSLVGWAAAIPNNPQRLFQVQVGGVDGAVFAFQNNSDVPVTTAFYTTSTLDSGGSGPAFAPFNPTLFVSPTFAVDIRPNFDPDNIVARFVVQMNGSNWYASATPLPVPSVLGGFVKYTQPFSSSASAWDQLTIGTTSATIGPPATSNLTGNVSGAGLVFSHTIDNGTFDFDDFRITATIGSLSATLLSTGAVRLTWFAGPTVRVQSSTNLAPGSWQDLTNTIGLSAAVVPGSSNLAFFRLSTGPAEDPYSKLGNLGFEADGAAVPSPSGWTTTGHASSDSVISGDAYGGAFCLQHSNSTSYQVQTSTMITNLPNGLYRLGARVKSSGGQKACFLAGNDRRTSLPPLTNWTETIVRGISVTNGQCLIQVNSDASSGNWCRVDAITLTNDNISYTFLKGGDVSELPRMEYYGGTFYDNGVPGDCLQIMTNHGCNIARIRLYNDPGNTNYFPSNQLDPLGWQNPARTLALAQRARAMGMQIQLTFHYSDYWSNPGTQYKPHAWEGLSFSALSNALYTFTRDFMAQMTNQGTPPELVSLGNEIRGGILFPDGANTNSAGWNRLADLLKGGYVAVKSVSPSSKVIIHIDKVDAPTVNYFFGNLQSRGVNYDIIGCSYYPFWTSLTTDQARDEINSWQTNYNKPVMIMETGYNWATNTCDGFGGQLGNNGPEIFPSTPLGQKNFLLKCFNDLKLVNGGQCLGDLYWDPVFICVPGQGWQNGGRNVVANTTLFDFTGHGLPSLDAFFYNN